MKAFFANLNFSRTIMLSALLGSLVLAWLGWSSYTRLQEYRENLEYDVPKIAKDLQQLGQKHTMLAKNLDKERLKGQADLDSYIRSCAAADFVEIGETDLTPQTTPNLQVRGISDRKVRIKPNDKDRTYTRTRIANFFYKLEADSRRVKVTDIQIQLADTKVKPHEIPDDLWTFQGEVTSRQRTE